MQIFNPSTGGGVPYDPAAAETLTNKTLISDTNDVRANRMRVLPDNDLPASPAQGDFLQKLNGTPYYSPDGIVWDQLMSAKTYYAAGYAVSTGTNNYSVTVLPNFDAYEAGQKFLVKFGNANSGAATLDINGKGALDLKK